MKDQSGGNVNRGTLHECVYVYMCICVFVCLFVGLHVEQLGCGQERQ